MMKKILFVVLALLSVLDVAAAKKVTVKTRFKEAYAALKEAKGQDAAINQLVDSLQLQSVNDRMRAEGYLLCARLKESVNDALNLKAYKKEAMDTAQYFNSVYGIFDYTTRCESVDATHRYAKKIAKLRKRHRQNLLSGGRYMLGNRNYAEAYRYFDLYLRTADSINDRNANMAAYWCVVSGVNEKSIPHTMTHIDHAIAAADAQQKPALAEYKARCIIAKRDSAAWVAQLEAGAKNYVGYKYFYYNLMDYYRRRGMFDRGVVLTDSLQKVDKDRPIYWETKSLLYLSKGDNDASIASSNECLSRDPQNATALYNKGIVYLNMALGEKDKNRCMEYYRQAMEPMEKVRELEPDNISRWGSPLYRIYLNLNLGDKFNEIDRLLGGH